MEQENRKEITLKDLWSVLIKRIWIMVLAAILCVGVFFVAKKITYTPAYTSTATLYILKQSDETVNNDYTLALGIVNDCVHLLTSHAVLDETINSLALDMSYSQLKGSISINNPTDTRILEVSVEADSPEVAKAIVDKICEIGAEKIKNSIGRGEVEQLSIHEAGTMSTTPSNGTKTLTYLLVGVGAAALVYIFFLVLYFLDDTIKTDEDVKDILGLSVLGSIPNSEYTPGRGYRYYASRVFYGKRAYTAKAKEEEKQ